ncbi:hypothetical protein IscW_ISCW003010 [Ixodes scapularis]|uniref:Uncharacterized protein n=1 Tax=Ixodes scapularis TaxID=6945 RepID=B7P960_IXOSC|nr:hypothetical protein IscW_ISCW003010 [Ixodes scapularis]|eukprot:XP_002403683.1 hypothetical protein IscW_ISCW003010 [Ixodes scapularis]
MACSNKTRCFFFFPSRCAKVTRPLRRTFLGSFEAKRPSFRRTETIDGSAKYSAHVAEES